ncbi:putative carbonic anhydrase [Halenospora varia]|nr:putative carbonic anhydrase [Halenospora varia]
MHFSTSALTSALAITAQACTEILGHDLYSRDAAEAAGAAAWDSEVDNGSLSWYNMDPKANMACGRGTKQTPIDVTKDTTTKQSTAAIAMNYGKFSNVKFERTHHTAQVQLDINNATKAANTLSWPGSEVFYLAQFQFHTPSEHCIDNEIYPMEVHFVHKMKEGSKAAVDLSIFLGYNNCLQTRFCESIDEWTYKDVKTLLGFNSQYTQADPGEANLLDPVRGGQGISTSGSAAPVAAGGSGH